ncbi:Bacteriophage holin family HP1 [Roseateles sp. YR242]|uniref:holin n=1 Tax=Roseateles sp. YR242 TaxID=1855305 RepID=UPI0008C6F6B0|nr:holin [Roseateles sp. YR242]SEL11767.1 Bacteriophage holin family HP1 [Roseateles sp. YR242]
MGDKTDGAVSAFEAAVAASGSKVTYSGAGAAVAGGLSSNDLVALIGLLIALGGFVVNWYYKRKHYELAERQAGGGGKLPEYDEQA